MNTPYLLRYEYLKSIPARGSQLESHDNYEIFYFHEGRGHYLIGDRIHSLTSGTLIVMHGLTLHSPYSFDGIPYVRTLINFDQAYIRAAAEQLFEINVLEPFERFGNYVVQLKDGEKRECEEILEKMHFFRKMPGRVAYERFRLAFVDALFFIYSVLQMPLCERPEFPTAKVRHIQDILTYIERHFTDSISLECLERHLHLNKYHLSRLFREGTGMTIFQYLLKRRLNHAKQLFLLEPAKSITDICYLCGFHNVSHFSKAFKQFEGRTPELYRRELHR